MNSEKFWMTMAAVLIGAVVALVGFDFFYAKGYSYISDNPTACINCHVMNDNYNSWVKGNHHHVAVCNDCHLPHNIFGKYAIKALNGFNHSLAFTLGTYKDVIRAKDHSRTIIRNACMHCHEQVTSAMKRSPAHSEPEADCLVCHQRYGHGK